MDLKKTDRQRNKVSNGLTLEKKKESGKKKDEKKKRRTRTD